MIRLNYSLSCQSNIISAKLFNKKTQSKCTLHLHLIRTISNIAIAKLEELAFLKSKKIISHFMVAIIFSPTVN